MNKFFHLSRTSSLYGTVVCWSPVRRYLVSFFILLCIISVWFWLWHKPLTKQLQSLELALQDRQTELKELEHMHKTVQEQQQTTPAHCPTLQQCEPLQELLALLETKKLKLLEVSNLEKVPVKDMTIQRQVKIQFRGNFERVAQFFDELTEQRVPLFIKQCTFTRIDDRAISCTCLLQLRD